MPLEPRQDARSPNTRSLSGRRTNRARSGSNTAFRPSPPLLGERRGVEGISCKGRIMARRLGPANGDETSTAPGRPGARACAPETNQDFIYKSRGNHTQRGEFKFKEETLENRNALHRAARTKRWATSYNAKAISKIKKKGGKKGNKASPRCTAHTSHEGRKPQRPLYSRTGPERSKERHNPATGALSPLSRSSRNTLRLT